MDSPTPPPLPLELHVQIISHLSFNDQIRAVDVCKSWRHIILNSKSMLKSRYSSERIARGIHHLISARSESFSCTVRGREWREYRFYGNQLRNDCPFLDEPLFTPAAWSGEDPELTTAVNSMEFDLFTSVPGATRFIWWGTEEWGRDVTVRGFIEGQLKPVLDAPLATPEMANGSITFFLAAQLIASAYTIACVKPVVEKSTSESTVASTGEDHDAAGTAGEADSTG
ncbi:hypothetical protein TWF281_009791 [Arthrobotrys megalospora]